MASSSEDKDFIDFQHYWLIFKRRWLVIVVVTGSVVGLSALQAFRQKPIYEAEGKLLFRKTDRISSLTNPSTQPGELNSMADRGSPLDTEAEVIRSNPIVKKTIANLGLTKKPGEPLEIDDFLTKLKVKNLAGTDILAVSYSSTSPQEATAVVNLLMNYYLENNTGINQAQTAAAKKFLSKQLPEIEARVAKAEADLRQFKEENKVVSLGEEATKGVENLNDLLKQINQTQANLGEAQTRSQLLQRQLKLNSPQAVVETMNLSQSKAVQQVLSEYQKAQDDLALAQTRYTSEHPEVANLKEKVAAMRKQLQLRIGENLGNNQSVSGQNLQMGELKQTLTAQLVQLETERSALVNRLTILQNAYTAFQKRLDVLPKLQQRQQQLEQQLQVARATYGEFLKRSQEVEVAVSQNIGNARVLSVALPKAVSSKIAFQLTIGGFLGILLGVGIALTLEALDRSLKTLEQAQQLFGYPLLGTIPPVRDNPDSLASLSLSFERLLTNLDFTFSNKPLKIIAVVSSTPGEGRSLVAAKLAIGRAQMGYRVLLIDANIRHSGQEEIQNSSNPIGLSNLLVDRAEFPRPTISEVVQKELVNLDVLMAGTISSDRIALIDSQRMASLLQEATKDYDCVIIDTPALSLSSNGLILSKVADGALLVVRLGVLELAAAQAAKTLLEQSGSYVVGMVVNGGTTASGFSTTASGFSTTASGFSTTASGFNYSVSQPNKVQLLLTQQGLQD